MLYSRQKLILTLLNTINEPVGSTDFQKLLFLFTHELEKKPSYEFVPYKFGCFSFTSYADKRNLIKKGLLVDDSQCWGLTPKGKETAKANTVRLATMRRFCDSYGKLRGDALIADVYRRYPYYAIRSEIVDKVIDNEEEKQRIKDARPPSHQMGLATIGYEGKTLERYLNQLLHAGVSILCDVRKNPLSRKYGFAKKTLATACKGVGIHYAHLPALGIASAARKELKTQADYDALFRVYERETLPFQQSALEQIQQWVDDGESVALTCYELLPEQCHRSRVARALEPKLGISSKHL